MSKFQYRAGAVMLAINSLDQRVTPVGVKTLRNGVLEMDEYIKSLSVQAHSKTEYKRMVAQGANVLPPGEREAEERKVCGVFWCPLQRPEQEPVAWIHNFIEGGISIGKRPSDLDRHSDRWTALFKNPKPCPTCEALSRTRADR